MIPLFSQENILTLHQSIHLGLENNNLIKISAAKVNESEARVNEINSFFFPKISLSATYARLSDVPPFEINTPVFPAPIKIQDAVLNTYNLKASLQQPLFTGFKLSSSKKAASFNNLAITEFHSAEINNTALNIATAFWNVYRAEKILDLARKSVERTRILLRDTKNFLDNGLVTKSDYLKIEVLYSNSRLLEIDSQNKFNLAVAAFNKEIGLDLNAATKISADEPVVDFMDMNLEELLKEGISNRKEIKSYSYRLEATNENITAANSGWYPNVVLFGNYYYSNPNQRIMPAREKFYDTWDLGVTLNWEIFDWGETASKSEQAEQQKIQSETALQEIINNIHLEIYSAYLTLQKELDKVKLNQLVLEQARENLSITKEQYSVQLALSSDLIDAETSYLSAETQLTSAKIDYELAKARLYKALGRNLY